MQNEEFAKELRKPIIRKFEERKVHSSFMDTIKKFNKGFRFFFRVIDIYMKYPWIIPLKDKKGITITNAFQNNLRWIKPNKIWIDKGSIFYNKSIVITEEWYRNVFNI